MSNSEARAARSRSTRDATGSSQDTSGAPAGHPHLPRCGHPQPPSARSFVTRRRRMMRRLPIADAGYPYADGMAMDAGALLVGPRGRRLCLEASLAPWEASGPLGDDPRMAAALAA